MRPEGDGFLFAHALIRDAVYDTLLKASRRALHRRAAAWFDGKDPALHAEHLDRAEDPAAPAAYLAAARAQAAVYHYEQALALVDRGLAIARGEPTASRSPACRASSGRISARWCRRDGLTRRHFRPPATSTRAVASG